MKNELNVALIQTNLVWEQPKANREHIESFLKAVSKEADIIFLPEMFSSGFTMNPERVAESMLGTTSNSQVEEKRATLSTLNLNDASMDNYVFTGGISNQAYVPDIKAIMILTKSGEVNSLQEHSQLFFENSFSKLESKFYLCFAKPSF